jgi:hypothetical protein
MYGETINENGVVILYDGKSGVIFMIFYSSSLSYRSKKQRLYNELEAPHKRRKKIGRKDLSFTYIPIEMIRNSDGRFWNNK